MCEVGVIIGLIKSIRLGPVRLEADVISEFKRLLDINQIDYKTEVKLGPHCRVDMLIGDIAVEFKKGKPNTSRVSEQLQRYAKSPMVGFIILVSERGLIYHITEASGKPVYYIALSNNWGLTI